MPLKINNSPSIIEPLLIALIAIAALFGSSYLALAVTVQNPLASPIPWTVAVAAGLFTFFVIKQAKGRTGSLQIDSTQKSFTLDNVSMHPYADLTYYKSGLIQTPIMKMFQSRMVITIGLDKKRSFTIMDDRSSIIGSVKNSKVELNALEELIAGSSLLEQQKASFEHWIFRARLNQRKE